MQSQPATPDSQTILSGFADPVHDAGSAFRAVLKAMSRPGRIVSLSGPCEMPQGMYATTAAVALALLDNETPVHLDNFDATAGAWLQFHCGCPITGTQSQAAFALIRNGMTLPDLGHYSIGTETYPDRSATCIIQVESFEDGDLLRLEGPGIKTEHRLQVAGLHRDFWSAFARNRMAYPMGMDAVLCAPEGIACLPRTVTARGPIACM